jgi:hypothetical protein
VLVKLLHTFRRFIDANKVEAASAAKVSAATPDRRGYTPARAADAGSPPQILPRTAGCGVVGEASAALLSSVPKFDGRTVFTPLLNHWHASSITKSLSDMRGMFVRAYFSMLMKLRNQAVSPKRLVRPMCCISSALCVECLCGIIMYVCEHVCKGIRTYS